MAGKKTELLHDMMEGRTYIQLKDPALDRMAWNHKIRETAEDQRETSICQLFVSLQNGIVRSVGCGRYVS